MNIYSALLRVLMLALMLSITCCASNHDMKKDGVNPLGGGFSEEEISPGFYRLVALGNQSPWPSERAARTTWKNRANQLCGKDAYQEINTLLDAGFQGYVPSGIGMLEARTYNTSISGFLLCDSSNMTREEALTLLENRHKANSTKFLADQNQEMMTLGGADCTIPGPNNQSTENFYRRGKLLLTMKNYSAALTCLMQAQEHTEDNVLYQDTCATIGMMYELGWGVEKDFATATRWYKKAGL